MSGFFDDIKDYGVDVFERLQTNATAESRAVETGQSRSFSQVTADFLREAIDQAKVSAASTFRESSAGKELIAEVKQQEINQTINQIIPYITIIGALFAVYRFMR